VITIISGLFVLGASCYILFLISDPLEELGGKIGKLLKLPEAVIASTFQALATSGPEIVMAILAATAVITSEAFRSLQLGEKACSGCLNMSFSAMDNLLGIGAVAIVMLLKMRRLNPDEFIPAKTSTIISLVFYVIISGSFTGIILNGIITVFEAVVLMVIGGFFVLCQFIIPKVVQEKNIEQEDVEDSILLNINSRKQYIKQFIVSLIQYSFLIFALVIFVRLCLEATFNMAIAGLASVGGVLIMFTSYVSSFPEFMLSYRYAINNKKNALLGMLFGSNVIDLAFAGFRAVWLGENMNIYTTGLFPDLLIYYILALPILGSLILWGLVKKRIKWRYAKPALAFYVAYIVSGFFLL